MASTYRKMTETVYRPGREIRVVLDIKPPTGTLAYGLEETPPPGWTISKVGENVTRSGSMVKIGVFFDGTNRVFNYSVVPPQTKTDAVFKGVASFNGVSEETGGVQTLRYDTIAPRSPK